MILEKKETTNKLISQLTEIHSYPKRVQSKDLVRQADFADYIDYYIFYSLYYTMDKINDNSTESNQIYGLSEALAMVGD